MDLGQRCLVALRDDTGDRVLFVAAINALGLPDICETQTAGDDHLGQGNSLVSHIFLPP